MKAASQSVVRIQGTACGLGIEGSGWIAGDGVIVTNAHVVAGEDDTTVTTPSGEEVDATAVHFDTRNDLAILGVDLLPGAHSLEFVVPPGQGGGKLYYELYVD